jgi:hypothetical protein
MKPRHGLEVCFGFSLERESLAGKQSKQLTCLLSGRTEVNAVLQPYCNSKEGTEKVKGFLWQLHVFTLYFPETNVFRFG